MWVWNYQFQIGTHIFGIFCSVPHELPSGALALLRPYFPLPRVCLCKYLCVATSPASGALALLRPYALAASDTCATARKPLCTARTHLCCSALRFLQLRADAAAPMRYCKEQWYFFGESMKIFDLAERKVTRALPPPLAYIDQRPLSGSCSTAQWALPELALSPRINTGTINTPPRIYIGPFYIRTDLRSASLTFIGFNLTRGYTPPHLHVWTHTQLIPSHVNNHSHLINFQYLVFLFKIIISFDLNSVIFSFLVSCLLFKFSFDFHFLFVNSYLIIFLFFYFGS